MKKQNVEIKKTKRKEESISYWPKIVLIILYFLLLFLPIKFIPDYLNLEKAENSKLILRTIITVQGSIFGILFAVVILHFNLTKEIFGRSTSNIFHNFRKQINYCIFIITSICLSFFTLIVFDSSIFGNVITPVYFCSVLFVIAIASVYPILMESLKSQNASTHISKMIDDIILEDLTSIYAKKNKSELEKIQEIESNPIYILRETAINVLQKEDSLLAQLIISKTTGKALSLIENKETPADPKLVIAVFNNIWDVIILKAVEKKNYPTLNYIWTIYVSFFKYISSNKKQIKDYKELIEIFKNYQGKLIEGKFNTVVKNSMWYISSSIKDQLLGNCPNEDEISDIKMFFEEEVIEDKYYDSAKNSQWDYISRELSDIFSFSLGKAISSKNDEVFNEIQYSYCFFMMEIADLNVGEKLKHLIVMDAFSSSFYKCQIALDQKLFSNTDDIKIYKSEDIYKWLDQDKKYFKRCMSILSDFILRNSETGKLGNLFFRTFNLGAIGRRCAQKYNQAEKYKECMEFTLSLLKRLQIIFESDLEQNSSKYLKLQEELNSFIRFHEKDNANPNKEFIAQIKKEIKTFKKAKEIQNNLNNKQVSWKS